MRKSLLLMLVMLVSVIAYSQGRIVGNNKIVKETRNIDDFTGISLLGSFDVVVTDGVADGKIYLEGDSNILPHIRTEVINGVLTLNFDNNTSMSYKKDIKVTVSNSNLKKILVTGSGDIDVKGKQTVSEMEVSITGSGDVKVNVLANSVIASVSGSGDIKISGNTQKAKLSVAGSGDIDAAMLKASEVDASVAGSGDIKIWAVNELNAKTTGSGNIKYKSSDGVKVNKSVTGSGSVETI